MFLNWAYVLLLVAVQASAAMSQNVEIVGENKLLWNLSIDEGTLRLSVPKTWSFASTETRRFQSNWQSIIESDRDIYRPHLTKHSFLSFSNVKVDENGYPGRFTDFRISKLKQQMLDDAVTESFEAAKKQRLEDGGMITLKLKKRSINAIGFVGYAFQLGGVYNEVWFFEVGSNIYRVEALIGGNDPFDVLNRLFLSPSNDTLQTNQTPVKGNQKTETDKNKVSGAKNESE